MTKEEVLDIIRMVEGMLKATGCLTDKRARDIKMARLFAGQGITEAAMGRLHEMVNSLVEEKIKAGVITYRQVLCSNLSLSLDIKS